MVLTSVGNELKFDKIATVLREPHARIHAKESTLTFEPTRR